MFYSLRTHDRFYFRGSGENIAGQHHKSNSIFPPTLQTMYGALRGNWIEQHGNYSDFKKGKYAESIGTIDSSGAFALRGLYIAKDNQLYLPLPLDTQVFEKEGHTFALPLLLKKGKGWESDQASYRFIAQRAGKSKDNNNMWIPVHSLAPLYMNQKVECFSFEHFVVPEEKIGIGLNPRTQTVQEGLLYQFTGYYLKDNVSLVVDMTLPEELFFVRFGNSGTLWSITESPQYQEQFQTLKKVQFEGDVQYLRITTLTPSVITGSLFEKDSHYRWNTNNLFLQAVVPRAQRLAGWDMSKNAPKPKFAMLEAGTVFVVKASNNIPVDNQVRNIMSQPHTDLLPEAGFGQILVTPFSLFSK